MRFVGDSPARYACLQAGSGIGEAAARWLANQGAAWSASMSPFARLMISSTGATVAYSTLVLSTPMSPPSVEDLLDEVRPALPPKGYVIPQPPLSFGPLQN
jgi:hypothetical protein